MDNIENCADCGKRFGFTERIFSNTNGLWICEDCNIKQIQENDNKDKIIADLEEKLAESEKLKESYRLQNDKHHLQLCQFYSRLGVEAFGADIHEKALETLMIMKEQLAEYGDINNALNSGLQERCICCEEENNQDKISFCIEKLEKVKDFTKTNDKCQVSYEYCPDGWDTAIIRDNLINYIDQLIAELKGGKNE